MRICIYTYGGSSNKSSLLPFPPSRPLSLSYLRYKARRVVPAPGAEAGHDSLHRPEHVQRRPQSERKAEERPDRAADLTGGGGGEGGGFIGDFCDSGMGKIKASTYIHD